MMLQCGPCRLRFRTRLRTIHDHWSVIRVSPRVAIARRVGPVLLGALLALVPSPPALAQTYQTVTEGLTFGHFVVYPSIAFEYTHDSNIFFSTSDLPDDVTASGIAVIRPRVMVDLPLSDSRIRWNYSPYYRDYTSQNFTGSNRVNHVFDLEGRFRTQSAITVAVRDHFLRGTLSIQDTNAANGLSFGLGRYSSHNPTVEIGLNFGARNGVSLIPSYARTSFAGISDTLQYAYSTRRIEGRYNYRLSVPTTFYGYSAYESNTQNQTGVEQIQFYTRVSGFGLTRSINETVVTQLSAGYQTMDFQGATDQRFSGPIVDGAAGWLLSDATRLEFGVLRHPYASVYTGNNYYIDTEGRLRLTLQVGSGTYLNAGVTGVRNVYAPQVGQRRRDRLIRFEVGLGHQFLRTLRGYIGATSENRRSNVEAMVGGEVVDPFHYRVDRLVFRLEAGWM